MQAIFRLASPEDAQALLEVYRPYVENTTVSFEYKVPTIEDFRQRVENISAQFPYILCIMDGEIVGYGYASKPKERSAYQWRAELSIYIEENFQRFGIAGAIYGALLEILYKQGYYNAYAVISSPNEKSEHFHIKQGFTKIGHYHKTGFKHGKWLDIIIYEKFLCQHGGQPLPTKTITQIDSAFVLQTLEKWQHKVKER